MFMVANNISEPPKHYGKIHTVWTSFFHKTDSMVSPEIEQQSWPPEYIMGSTQFPLHYLHYTIKYKNIWSSFKNIL